MTGEWRIHTKGIRGTGLGFNERSNRSTGWVHFASGSHRSVVAGLQDFVRWFSPGIPCSRKQLSRWSEPPAFISANSRGDDTSPFLVQDWKRPFSDSAKFLDSFFFFVRSRCFLRTVWTGFRKAYSWPEQGIQWLVGLAEEKQDIPFQRHAIVTNTVSEVMCVSTVWYLNMVVGSWLYSISCDVAFIVRDGKFPLWLFTKLSACAHMVSWSVRPDKGLKLSLAHNTTQSFRNFCGENDVQTQIAMKHNLGCYELYCRRSVCVI